MKIFNSIEKLGQDWKYIGMFYASLDSGQPLFHCQTCLAWTIVGKENIQSKLEHMESRFKPGWNPLEHLLDFIELIKEIMFIAQGDPKAPVTQAMQVNKLSQNIDKNMIFWTPEQLNILNSNSDFCLLMAYYGCGKTWCLIERAKYLLKDQNNIVHFFLARHRLDKDESLLDHLRSQFKTTRINPTNIRTYYSFAQDKYQIIKDLEDAGVEKSHHILLDELIIANTEAFVTALKDVQSCVASAWIATRGFGRQVEPDNLRSKITSKTGFQCPELNHCLRNSKEIVNFATSLEAIRNFSCQPLGQRLNINLENYGIFHHFDEIFEDPILALKEALNQSPRNKKSLIVVTHSNLHLQEYQRSFSNLTFKDFSNR